jgi:hypothetical protein
MAEESKAASVVSLNDLVALSPGITSRVLADALMRRHLAGLTNANCPSGFCDCNNGYCACRGPVSADFDPAAAVVLPADQLREAKIEMLRQQLRELESQK